MLLSLLIRPAVAHAGEIQVGTGPIVSASSWRGDAAVGQSLRIGYRFANVIAIDTVERLAYATVDERVLTVLSLGGTVYGRVGIVRPYVRAAFVHQHEEPIAGVHHDPFGAVFGVGDGIRHRGGFGASFGIEVPVRRWKTSEVVLGADASGMWFPDPRGPAIYAGGGLWLALNAGL